MELLRFFFIFVFVSSRKLRTLSYTIAWFQLGLFGEIPLAIDIQLHLDSTGRNHSLVRESTILDSNRNRNNTEPASLLIMKVIIVHASAVRCYYLPVGEFEFT